VLSESLRFCSSSGALNSFNGETRAGRCQAVEGTSHELDSIDAG
jgi:hypothetical protein